MFAPIAPAPRPAPTPDTIPGAEGALPDGYDFSLRSPPLSRPGRSDRGSFVRFAGDDVPDRCAIMVTGSAKAGPSGRQGGLIISIESIGPGALPDYDVAIVGAGAAGITLALELEGTGLRVALLEGGGREHTDRSQRRYRGPLTTDDGLDYPPLDAWRLRYLGGTTNHWTGWCRPLEENAFAPRRGRAELGWPFPRDELARAYARAHEICGLGRAEYDAATLCADGGYALPFHQTTILTTPVWRFSPPTRFGTQYLSRLETGTTDVYVGANCAGIDASGERVQGVRILSDEGAPYEVRARQVVLACGAIENVRQLLLTAEAGLGALNRSGVLGVGFREHIHVAAAFALADRAHVAGPGARLEAMHMVDTARDTRPIDVDGTRFRVGLGLTADAMDAHEMVNVSFTLENIAGAPDELPHGRAVASLYGAQTTQEVALLMLYARAEQRHVERSRITLASGADDLGLRRAALHWAIAEEDMRDIRVATQLVARELMSQGMGPISTATPEGQQHIVTGGAHHMGGARMHEDPDIGVVDEHGQCHALEGLYVAGSAVFPSTCFSNPTLTIVALAVRLAATLEARA